MSWKDFKDYKEPRFRVCCDYGVKDKYYIMDFLEDIRLPEEYDNLENAMTAIQVQEYYVNALAVTEGR